MKLVILLLCFIVPFQTYATADFSASLSEAAVNRTKHNITYDPSYFPISYPNGDVPSDKGVCTDVVIRSYRAIGIDLQKLVHEDMNNNFSKYPKDWGLKRTDKNIDHRRVPNLRVFFTRNGQKLKISDNPSDYKAGDLVTWSVRENGSLPHIGIVTDKINSENNHPLIVHNIGNGPKLEDMLFDYRITGHYRYEPNYIKGNN